MTDFVHLHVHSDYSLLRSAASVEGLAAKAASLGMKHLALTDYGFMSGIPQFVKACEEVNINPIIGCEFYLERGYIVLLASNEKGYQNLIRLSSRACTEKEETVLPAINEQVLRKYHEGLIGISGIRYKNIPDFENNYFSPENEEEETALRFQEIFGAGNFYLELLEHGSEARKLYNSKLVDISRRTGIPVVAANDVHYLEREDARAHSVMLCIDQCKTIDDYEQGLFTTDEFYFKTGEEMIELFKEYPEAIANTFKIAERCKVLPKQKPQLPEFEIPEGFASSHVYLRELVMQGIEKRYQNNGIAKQRAEYELDIITRMGFSDYFLIVADYVNWALEQGIPVGPGRGSAVSSIATYALGITNIDPLTFQLPFECFINPELTTIPDIDMDFSCEGREKVAAYITEKYGKERVARIITFGTLGAKAVIKDTARALSIPSSDSEMIAKLIPFGPKITLQKAIDEEPKLQEMERDPRYTELFELACKLEGLHRHASVHAAGIVIGKSSLIDLVPLCQLHKEVTTQYSMAYLEDFGLVKMDILGLKALDVIKRTEELISSKSAQYADFSVKAVPENDQAVFSMLGAGESYHVFQFESEGMQNILRQVKPSSIEDLIILNAMYRPGTMEYIPMLIRQKQGGNMVEYPDPCLEDILKETYGILVYQEQIMYIIQRIAGYSLAQADLLRRTLCKQNQEQIIFEKENFVMSAEKNGFEEPDAERIFALLVSASPIAFNKSNALAYALVAYRTAYLKAHFRDDFEKAVDYYNASSFL